MRALALVICLVVAVGLGAQPAAAGQELPFETWSSLTTYKGKSTVKVRHSGRKDTQCLVTVHQLVGEWYLAGETRLLKSGKDNRDSTYTLTGVFTFTSEFNTFASGICWDSRPGLNVQFVEAWLFPDRPLGPVPSVPVNSVFGLSMTTPSKSNTTQLKVQLPQSDFAGNCAVLIGDLNVGHVNGAAVIKAKRGVATGKAKLNQVADPAALTAGALCRSDNYGVTLVGLAPA